VTSISRRKFVRFAAAGAAALSARSLFASPLGLPLGVQLFSVRDFLPKSYEGTLSQLHNMGYREVEAAGFFGRAATDVRRAMAQAGVRCVSAHYAMPDLKPNIAAIIDYGRELGLDHIVCSAPMMKDPSRAKGLSWNAMMEAVTLDDWRWNCTLFNELGQRIHEAGMNFAYHNHFVEFHSHHGIRPYDIILKETDPRYVSLEMDCGWVIVGGARPEDYLTRYPNRFVMLHVKEFNLKGWKPGEDPVSTEMGRGSIDYKPIFEAASHCPIRHIFVEQEAFPDMPAMQALQVDANWLKAFPNSLSS
jgi:sugar phosphate isomerase/epimerase